jgi:hypothetical protein
LHSGGRWPFIFRQQHQKHPVPLGIGRFGKLPSLEPDVLAMTAEIRRLGTNLRFVPTADGVNCAGNMLV